MSDLIVSDVELVEFDLSICEDMEFTGECIDQTALFRVSKDFNKAEVSEFLCLRQHSCCRKRLAKQMVAMDLAESLPAALEQIIRNFIQPANGEVGVAGYLQMDLPVTTRPQPWLLAGECIPEGLIDLYDEHTQNPEDELVEQEEVHAIQIHCGHCEACKNKIATLPGVALNSF